jgi:hypothetical protein
MRRYDLDWLRVIVFGLLIFYHVGMFFIPWEWHIKNSQLYPDLKWPMLFVNQWRLPILFIISGMGTAFALQKRTARQFAGERLSRLLLPLIAGIILIVPPQVYLERVAYGEYSGDYFDFWISAAFKGIYPEGNFSWHHLWFLPYLLFFSLILIPAFFYLKNHSDNYLLRIMKRIVSKPLGIFWLIIPLYLWEAFLEPFFPSTHAFIDDWFNLINYITLFFYGFLLISIKETFWKTIQRYRRSYLYMAIFAFIALVYLWTLPDSILIHFIEAGVKVLNMWAWIITIFGYASAYLNKQSKSLSYANEAVYPFYILHQTVTVILGFIIMNMDMNLFIKFTFLTLGTFLFTWIIYEFLIRRWNWLRPVFGLKKKKSPNQQLCMT